MARKVQRNPFEKAVHFTGDELAYVQKMADERQAVKMAAKVAVRDNSYRGGGNADLHFIGLLGEIAVARLVHGIIDLRSYLGGDSGQDMLIHGAKVEVKCLQGFLAFKSIGHFVSDIAVLVIHNKSDFSCLWVQGWVTKEEFVKNHFTDDFGYGMRPVMQPSALLPIETMKTFCLTRQMFLPYMNGAAMAPLPKF